MIFRYFESIVGVAAFAAIFFWIGVVYANLRSRRK